MGETITVHDPWIAVDTPGGPGLCMSWHNYGAVANEHWKVALMKGRGVIFFPHFLIRVAKNYTLGLTSEPTPFPPLPDYIAKQLEGIKT